MSLYTEAPPSVVARLVAAQASASTDLSGFFGARIGVLTLAEAEVSIRSARLAVIAQVGPERRIVGGNIDAEADAQRIKDRVAPLIVLAPRREGMGEQ